MPHPSPQKIENAVERIQLLPQQDQKRYFRALRFSLLGDGDRPPQPISGNQIKQATSIPVDIQHKYGILLDKRQAHEYLRENGLLLGWPLFRKSVAEPNYTSKFQKPVTRGPNRLILLTYLETILFTNGAITMPAIPFKYRHYLEIE
ncbi:hypothetical protein KQI52_15270 [bacterium]|nr:hypothetical protein [bacterium]